MFEIFISAALGTIVGVVFCLSAIYFGIKDIIKEEKQETKTIFGHTVIFKYED